MVLACATNTFGRQPLHRALGQIAEAGYRAVEILADIPHLFPPTKGLSRLKTRLSGLGLAAAAINGNTAKGWFRARSASSRWLLANEPVFGPSLCHPDPAIRAWRVAYTRACLEAASELGAGCVCLTSGWTVPGCPPERARMHLLRSLEGLLRHAERLGVRMAIEYEPGLLVERFAEAASVIRAVRSPWLGVNLDVGHAVVCGENPAALIAAHPSLITHLHLEDIRNGKHYHLVPGEGSLSFRGIIEALRRIRYAGAMAVELYTYAGRPLAAARRALRVLRPLLRL